MFTHPLRCLTNINNIGVCCDDSNDNIIYFGNYVLFRPCYQRDKYNYGYNYGNAILVDLEKSHIDISKYYQLLNNHNIDITKQTHMLWSMYKYYEYDNEWLELLKQASVSHFIEIPNTEAYYLNRIQFDIEHNTLLITHKTYYNPRTYTLINLDSLTIIDSEFGISKARKYISISDIIYDCKFEYSYESLYINNNCEFIDISISNEYININFDEIICRMKILKTTKSSILSKYTHVSTNAINSNGLLFIIDGAWDVNWHLKNNSIDDIQHIMNSYNIVVDIQYIIYEYLLCDIYTYLNQINNLMQLIYISAFYYLITNPCYYLQIFTELAIPNTYVEFCKNISRKIISTAR